MCVWRKFGVRCCVAKRAFGAQWCLAMCAKFSKANTAWCGEFDNETAKRGKIQRHSNKIQHSKFSVASVCGQSKQSESGGSVWAGLLSLSLIARTFWHTEIFKRFVFGLFTPVIASRFCENGVASHKFSVAFALWIATLALLARNDGKENALCHLAMMADFVILSERNERKIHILKCKFALQIYGYFAAPSMTKISRYDKGKINRQNKTV